MGHRTIKYFKYRLVFEVSNRSSRRVGTNLTITSKPQYLGSRVICQYRILSNINIGFVMFFDTLATELERMRCIHPCLPVDKWQLIWTNCPLIASISRRSILMLKDVVLSTCFSCGLLGTGLPVSSIFGTSTASGLSEYSSFRGTSSFTRWRLFSEPYLNLIAYSL